MAEKIKLKIKWNMRTVVAKRWSATYEQIQVTFVSDDKGQGCIHAVGGTERITGCYLQLSLQACGRLPLYSCTEQATRCTSKHNLQ